MPSVQRRWHTTWFGQESEALAKALVSRISEKLLSSTVQPQMLRDFQAGLQEQLRTLDEKVECMVARQFPSYVECQGGTRHVTLGWATTHCGWSWAAAGAVPISATPQEAVSTVARAEWCACCYAGWQRTQPSLQQAPVPVWGTPARKRAKLITTR